MPCSFYVDFVYEHLVVYACFGFIYFLLGKIFCSLCMTWYQIFWESLNEICLFCTAPLRAPKWYKRPAGVSFGFGGKLVSFRPGASASGSPAGASEARFYYLDYICLFRFLNLSVEFILFVIFQVYVHSLVTEDGLVSRSSEFEAAIQNGERTLLRVLCDKKSQESE